MSGKNKWFMRLTIRNTDTGKTAFAMYPSSRYERLESLDACGVPYGGGNYNHLAVSYNGVEADSLQRALTGVIEHKDHPPSISELNFLGAQICAMPVQERSRMEQQLANNPDATIVEAINLANKIAGYGYAAHYDGISMATRFERFSPDEPYLKVRLATEDEAYTVEDAGIWVDCPTSDAELKAVADKLGVDSYHDLEVCDVYGILENIADDMCGEFSTTFDRLNALAKAMKDNEIFRQSAKYKAVLSVESYCDLKRAAELAANLDSYEFYQGESLADVGRRFQAQNSDEYDVEDWEPDEVAEHMGFEESEYGTLREIDGLEQKHTGPTLC